MDQAIRKRHRFRGVIKPLPQRGRADDGGFAGRILQKYRRRQGWWGFISLIFQRQYPAATTHIRQQPLWQQIVFHRQQLVIPASLQLAFLQHASVQQASFYPAGILSRFAERESSRSGQSPAPAGAPQLTFWRQWFRAVTQRTLPDIPATLSPPASPGGTSGSIPLRRLQPGSRYPAEIQQHLHAEIRYRWLLQPQGGREREGPASFASGSAGSRSRQQTFPVASATAPFVAANRASLNLLQTVVQDMRFQQQIRTDFRRGAAGNFGAGILRHLLPLSGATGGLRAEGMLPHPAVDPQAAIATPSAGAARRHHPSVPSQPGPFHLYRQSPGMAHIKPHAGMLEELKQIASPDREAGKTPAPAQPPPPPAPAVDIQRITDQVMDELQRKLRIEKERRGLL